MKELHWTGAKSYELTDFNDGDIINVTSEPLYYSTLFRFLTLLLRDKNVILNMTPELKEIAQLTGFEL
jgi:hypothetical protein